MKSPLQKEWDIHVKIEETRQLIESFERVQRGRATKEDVDRVHQSLICQAATCPDQTFDMEASLERLKTTLDSLERASVLPETYALSS